MLEADRALQGRTNGSEGEDKTVMVSDEVVMRLSWIGK